MTSDTARAPDGTAIVTALPAREEFEAFVGAGDVTGRTAAFVRLIRALRPRTSTAWKDSAFAPFIAALEIPGPDRDRFGAAVAALIAETDATNLVSNAGIPGHRGFFSEFGDRLSARLVPQARDDRDFEDLLRHVFRAEADIVRFGEAPLDVFHRLVTLLQTAPPKGAWRGLQATLADGFRLLLSRVESEGLSHKLRQRSSAGPVSASPFFRVQAAGEALLSGWIAGRDVSAAAAEFRKASGECRKEARRIQQHLEEAGVSVDIVFSLEVIERCLTRTALMAEIVESPTGAKRSRAIYRLLRRLFVSAHEDRSLWHLVSWNLQLLGRKIVDRAGETGEHYIARSRKEYRHIWLAAAGGGLLTVGTALVKSIVHGWHLPAGPEGVLYGLNYAVSFVLLQHLGLILATKQPAMTAARLAGIISETDGEGREERVADEAARLASSQLAAAVANVLVVSAGAFAAGRAFTSLTGHTFFTDDEAVATLLSISPVDSMTIWYAILTGVILWVASIAGGWFDNWCVYHRIPEGIARHPAGARFGRARAEAVGRAVARHASGWGTNISLGFMLGMAPAVGRFTGLPFDVRHVTLNSGIMALAASGLEAGPRPLAFLIWAASGIAVMFIFNLSVSFACSLLNATKAYELPGEDVRGILRGIGRRLARSPLQFVRPPKPDASGAI